jgi:hypothetical protein
LIIWLLLVAEAAVIPMAAVAAVRVDIERQQDFLYFLALCIP